MIELNMLVMKPTVDVVSMAEHFRWTGQNLD
jgi:hypothetical protein